MQEHNIKIIFNDKREQALSYVDNLPVKDLEYFIDGEKLRLSYKVRQHLFPKTIIENNLFKFVDKERIKWRRKFILFGKLKPVFVTDQDGQVRTNLFVKFETVLHANWTIDKGYMNKTLTDVFATKEK